MSKDKKFDIEELFYNITMENPCGDKCNTGKKEKDDKFDKCIKQDKYEKEDKCEKHNKQDKHEKDDKYEKCNKQDKCEKDNKCNKHDEYEKCDENKKEHESDCSKNKDICFDPCELCKTINTDPVDIEKNGVRLLTVKLKVNNVCFDKKVAVACIIYDKCHRILAFKGFITMICKEYECSRNSCGTIERKLVFIVPDHDLCDPLELDVRIMANYVYPCESKN